MTVHQSSTRRVLTLLLVLAIGGGLGWYLFRGGSPAAEEPAALGPLGERGTPVAARRDAAGAEVEPIRPIPLTRREPATELRAQEALRQLRTDPRAARLEGRVEDHEGAGVPDAELVLYELSGTSALDTASDPEVARFRSDERGRFLLPAGPLCGGLRYAMEVTHSDYSPTVVERIDPLDPATLVLVVQLGPGLALRGRVSRDGGASLAGAEVVVFSEERTAWQHGEPFVEASGTSDSEGHYEIAHLTPGTKRVEARHPGFATRSRGGVRLDSRSAAPKLDFVLAPGTAIAGRVIDDQTGGGVPEVTVFVAATGAEGERSAGLFCATDDAGRFRIDGLIPGMTYVLGARGEGLQSPLPRNVTAGEEEILIQLQSGASVSGEVVDAASGSPVESFALGFCPGPTLIASAGARGRRFSDSQGRFTLRGAPTGTRYLVVRAPGYGLTVYGPVEVEPGQQAGGHRIALERGAEVIGRVVNRGGVPISGCAVWLDELVEAPQSRVKDRLVDTFEVPRHQTSSLDDGSFIVVGVTMGRYRVRVKHPGHAPATSPVFEVASTGEMLLPAVVLDAAARLEGLVRDGGGSPDPFATVLVSEIGNEREGLSAPTDGSGRFRLTGLRAGRYEVRLVRCGGRLFMAAPRAGGSARGASRRVTLIAGEVKEIELRGP